MAEYKVTDKLRIGPHARTRKGMVQFINDLLAAGKEGFELPRDEFNILAKLVFGRQCQVFLYKYEEVDQGPKVLTKEILEDKKTSKEDLLAFAAQERIEIPKEKKAPLAISKFLRETLEAKDIPDQE